MGTNSQGVGGPGAVVRRSFWAVKALGPERLLWRWRRASLLARARLAATWHRAELRLDVAPDLAVGRDVRVEVVPRTTTTIRIGPGCRLGDRVLLRLGGGSILFGERCELRRDCVVNLGGGALELAGRNIFSWGCRVHCAQHVRLEPLAGVAEDVTVADSTHHFTEPDAWFYDNTRTAPIVVGANTWICPKATITSGVKIGQHCIVASGSVVIDDVPDGHLASGVPATDPRPMRLPWHEPAEGA